MRFMSTKLHAVMDYWGGILLIVVPLFWMDSQNVPPAAIWTPVAIGGLMLLQSLFTDYEFSLANVIPVPAHLGMDALAGVVLAVSPWVFGFADAVWKPHVIVGVLEMGAALTTKLRRSEPAHPRTGGHVHA
jgi:hypothetical protein